MNKKFYGIKLGETEVGLTTDLVEQSKEQLKDSSKKLKKIISGNEDYKYRRG